jgi:two-component system, chemotaxis family, chemotaxis protein CheY
MSEPPTLDPSARILIADDFENGRKQLKKLLEKLGFAHIEEAENGEELLHMIRTGRYDLVISDWEIPRVKAVDLVRALRKEAAHENLPFVVVAPVSKKEPMEKSLESGVTDYLCKPLTAEVLKRKLSSVLG